MTFCPNALIWGDVAAWASALGALIVGAGIWAVSRRTNKLAGAANRTHEALRQIEEQRDQERLNAASERRTLALASIGAQVSLVIAHVNALIETINQKNHPANLLTSPDAHDIIAGHIAKTAAFFPEDIGAIAREISLSEGATLLRAAQIPPIVLAFVENSKGQDLEGKHEAAKHILVFLHVALRDLTAILDACIDAERACGLRNVPTPQMLDALRSSRRHDH